MYAVDDFGEVGAQNSLSVSRSNLIARPNCNMFRKIITRDPIKIGTTVLADVQSKL